MTLELADIIAAGTRLRHAPPQFLRARDEMHLGIDWLGE
jgi:hypothetical protein